METKDLFLGEYLSPDEIVGETAYNRVVTILGNPRVHKYDDKNQILLLDVQFANSKKIRPLRVTQRLWRFFKQWGTNTDDWIGKSFELSSLEYSREKFTLQALPYDLGVERVH